MARFKNYLLVVVGFALAGLIGAAFGTGTAQAVVSTLVSVVNPTTSPVPTSSVNATDPGRIAYQSTIDMTNKCSGTVCDFNFPTVPAGHRVVVQHIAGVLDFNAVPTTSPVLIASGSARGPIISAFLAPFEGSTVSLVDQPLLFYVDSSGSVVVEAVANGATFFANGRAILTLTGYELDCTVAACAAIATQ